MRILTALAAILAVAFCASAQAPVTGIPPFSSLTTSQFDTINNQNLNTYFAIPLVSSAGRGMPLSLSLVNNSLLWQKSGTSWAPVVDGSGNPTWGWQKDFPIGGYVYYTSITNNVKCEPGGELYPLTTYSNFVYVDVLGTRHTFFGILFRVSELCPSEDSGTKASSADDSSGFYLDATTPTAPIVRNNTGKALLNGSGPAIDTNGNFVTKTVMSATETDWTDSVGNKALEIIYTPNSTNPGQIQYKFLDGTGASNYQALTLILAPLNIKTAFGCSGVGEYTSTSGVNLPSELDIPTPSGATLKYLFTYEVTPGSPSTYTGRVKRVTLPTGGYYEYDYGTSNDGINCSDGTSVNMNRVISDGTSSATWNFVRNVSLLTTTLTTPELADTPNANDTVYTFNSSAQEISRKIYSNSPGTGTPLRIVNTAWASNGTPALQTTILEDGSTQSEIDTTFDSYGNLLTGSEYDWGTGAHGNLLRTTALTYLSGTNYASRNIVNRLTETLIKDSTGTIQYRQDTGYDETALTTCPAGALQHDGTDYPCTMNYRGNATSTKTYLDPVTPASPVTKNFVYDWFGNLIQADLNCCQKKTWTYSATTQYSQPDSVTSGSSSPQLTTSATYNLFTGETATSTDENNQLTHYYYDFMRRPTSIVRPDSTTLSQSYSDSTFTTATTTPIDSSKSNQQVTSLDGLGRPFQLVTEDGTGTVYSVVQSKNDLVGRAYQTSNPYTGSPSYWTTTNFDVLGRPTSVKAPSPDGSQTSYTYATNTVTVTNPASKKRKSQSDAAGRLVNVWEPDSSNNLTVQTTNAYTILDSLTTVTEGSQTRTYGYDKLGRLTSSTVPETNNAATQYQYNNYNFLTQRTDPRGVITTYSYDDLNRPYQITYNVGTTGVAATPTVTFTYGTTPTSFNNGLIIARTDGPGSETYVYNNLGEVMQVQKVMGTTTYTIGYQYNLAGEMKQITYPSGRVVQQSFDAIGRLCEIAPSTTGCATAASPYTTGYGYNTASELTGFNFGNGVVTTLGYSPDRLQMTSLKYTKASTTLFSLNYGYGAAGSNNGQISAITDNVDAGRSVAYVYDNLARLSTATTIGSTSYPKWGLQETYDRYGNRTAQAVTSGTAPANSVAVNAITNQITTSGYSYDANGNMTKDGSNTLTYDGENHALTSSGSLGSGTYSYDGNGLRVTKVSASTTTVYVFSGSKAIAEYVNGVAPTSPTREYIYTGNTLIAKIETSATNYYHPDHLSVRTLTDSSGNLAGQQGHYPFGESWYLTNTTTKWEFTSYERDSETGNDYAMFRYDISRLGRFASPDPMVGNADDPQSLNRYAYSRNEPIDFFDPTGMQFRIVRNRSDLDEMGGTDDMGGEAYIEGEFPSYAIAQVGTSYVFLLPGGQDYSSVSTAALLNAAEIGEIIEAYSYPIYDMVAYLEGSGDPNGPAGPNGGTPKGIDKNSLKTILMANPECAKLLGGLPNALNILSQAQRRSTNAPGWKMPTTFLNPLNGPLVTDVAAPKGYAGTDFGGSPDWDGKSFTIYTNINYDHLSPSEQMTVDIHEFEHVALGDTDASRNGLDNGGIYPGSNISLISIHKLCGTDLPKLD
jgi:RHS repeat-associated protein